MNGNLKRLAAACGIVLATATATAACGGPSSTPSTSATSDPGASKAQKTVAYADCLRSHGVTGVSVGSNDSITINEAGLHMTTSGGIQPGGGPLPAAIESAAKACKSLVPSSGAPSNQAPSAQDLAQAVKYAQCIRKHGIPNFPDVGSDGSFNLSGTTINPQSSQFQAAQRACKSQAPPQLGFSGGNSGKP
jgi:hypothetical protein